MEPDVYHQTGKKNRGLDRREAMLFLLMVIRAAQELNLKSKILPCRKRSWGLLEKLKRS